MWSAWRLALQVACALMCVLVVGCERKMPPLVEVLEVGPRSLERHDLLQIRGSGFPAGRSGTVLFRGVLHSPGERPSAVEITSTGRVTADEILSVRFDEALERRFAARAGKLRHVTFDGTVEVRFERAEQVVFGFKDGVQLDIRPNALRAGDGEEGSAMLAALGITAAEGLLIAEIDPGGVADRHGLRAGDRLVEVAGVRVHDTSDLSPHNVPVPLSLRFLRDGEHEEHSVSIDEPPFPRSVPIWMTFAVLAFAALSVVSALLVSRRLTRIRRWEIALGALVRSPLRTSTQPRRALLWGRGAAALLVLAIALLPLSERARELDVPTVLVAWIAVSLVALRPAAGASRGIKNVLTWLGGALAAIVPLAALVGLAVSQTVALRLVDVASAQGEWFLLQTPWMLLIAASVLGSRTRANDTQSALTIVRDGLGGVLFLVCACGGWSSPFGAAPLWAAPIAFVSKMVLLMVLDRVLIEWTRRAEGRRNESLLPFAAIAAAAVVGHLWIGTTPVMSEWLGPIALVLVLVVVALLAVRAWAVPPSVDDELEPA